MANAIHLVYTCLNLRTRVPIYTLRRRQYSRDTHASRRQTCRVAVRGVRRGWLLPPNSAAEHFGRYNCSSRLGLLTPRTRAEEQ